MPTAGSRGGPGLVAWDKQTGEIRGAVDLPAGTIGTPMTYLVDGRQYIAVSIGGGPRVVALRAAGGLTRRQNLPSRMR